MTDQRQRVVLLTVLISNRLGPFAWLPISKEDRDSSRLHITFTELAKQHGPLMMMKFNCAR
ncbi:hypothetical protein Scep_021107 [Stephania cephalantha]|uniref:Uncharacterized protein n=1 Tax=Stephania cephalantha TaxID=152367 RepID=A0AAP0HWK5_9MAGN